MARTTARVDEDRLAIAANDEASIVVGTPAWFQWLESATAFTFTCATGKFTARKEAKQRGGQYWKAYHTASGTLHRAYLGKTDDLTMDRLINTAATLAAASVPKEPSTPDLTDPASASASEPTSRINLLAAKLNVPTARAHLVARTRLFERLETGLQGKLTLIAAPAGSGKTTLLSAWRTTDAGSRLPFAWVSLDSGDNDPLVFWSYVLTAIDSVAPGAGSSALTLLQALQPPPIERILANMLNALVALHANDQGRNVALVLEDYHVITTPAIHSALAWLLDYLPATLHLVIVTRADPALPLARLRARGDLTEIHAGDLRFTPHEAAAFLNQVMGLALTPEDLAALELRTEGWIAGLQLAALALRDNRDRAGFIRTFSGNNRYIVDYLAAEVFERQPAQVQNFLLRTAILDRMCGPLCDVVLGLPGPRQGRVDEEGTTLTVPEPPSPGVAASQGMLEELERNNMFVVPLDEERNWYRYHHLLGDVLRQRLARSVSAEDMASLHERASLWYETQGLVAGAIQHALMISDGLLAATLLERHALGVIVGGQVQTALDWLSRLPESLLLTRPRLCIYHALALLFANQFPAAEARVQDAERCIRPDTTPPEAQEIQGYAAAIRANMALYTGDLASGVAYGEQVLSLLPETEVIARTTARSHVARAFRVTGDVTLASERRVVAALEPIRATGSLLGTLAVLVSLARLQEMQGRLRSAAATYRQMDELFTAPDDLRGLHGSTAYDVGLGDLHREWNELDAAGAYLARAMELLPGRVTVDAGDLLRGYTALARLQHARGEYGSAQETLAAFQDLARRRSLLPHLVTGAEAVQAQLMLAAGNLFAAVTWADESGLHSDDELSYFREAEYLVLARVWIAQTGSDASSDLLTHTLNMLDRLMADAAAKDREASVLEILIVRALALRAQGNIPDAMTTLVRALNMAAPEGYIRRFVDEGSVMKSLLQAVDTRAVTGGVSYVPRLLEAFTPDGGMRGMGDVGVLAHGEFVPTQVASHSSRNTLPEPLSGRELEVLRLIADGWSNAEVATELVIALSTVKTHTNSIFSKLGATSRTQAVARARDLHLI